MPPLGKILKRAPRNILDDPYPQGVEDLLVSGVSHDSRKIRKDGLFVALRGLRRDGQDYVPQAEGNGASAVVSDRSHAISRAMWLRCSNPRRALAHLAASFYDHPSRDMRMVGVTGTNGKTTVCWFLRDAWQELGHKSASLGTLGVAISDPELHLRVGPLPWPALTTPEAPDYQATLARLLKAGVRHVACEVSSHALSMDRVLGTHFEVVVFTNLGRDHLDYHGTEEAYRDAKRKLFSSQGREAFYESGTPAVLNVDDAEGRHLAETLAASREGSRTRVGWPAKDGARVVAYGMDAENGPWLTGNLLESGREGLLLEAIWPGGRAQLRAKVIGSFQAPHLLAALGTLMALGTPGGAAAEALSKVTRVPGRMEPVGGRRQALILVDFAHTPEALDAALRECRSLAEGRLVAVFGCGGDRDRGKRPLMGLTAGQLADEVIVTTDNARSEDPKEIAEEVTEGLRATSARWQVILDRRCALEEAVRRLDAGDVLLVAGRGAEKVQKIGDQEIPIDDREVLREIMGTAE